MADVFISFIHEEHKVAAALQELLRQHLEDSKVFLSSDEWQIFAGEMWLEKIRAELTPAKVVVLMLSERSVARPWVNFEAGGAWLSGKVIIPACYGQLSKGSLPKPYSNIQAVDLPDDSYYLVRSVCHHLGGFIPPPPFFSEDKYVTSLTAAIAALGPADSD